MNPNNVIPGSLWIAHKDLNRQGRGKIWQTANLPPCYAFRQF
jgi:hypothetical protein